MPAIFLTLDDLYQEWFVEEELVRRMESKWEKVVDKVASKALGRKLIACGSSANWRDEELQQFRRIVEVVLLKVLVMIAIGMVI